MTTPSIRRLSLVPALALLALSTPPLLAEDVFITAYKGAAQTSDITPAPYCTYGGPAGGVSASGSSSFSSANPQPGISPRRSRFGTLAGASWSVQPGDNATYGFSSLQSPGVYRIYVTMPTSGTTPGDIVVNITATGGDLADTNGAPQTSIPTSLFRTTSPAINNWIAIAYITNNTPNPVITFTHASGGFNRFYMDAIRFENLNPCTGVAPTVLAAGPLAAGQSFVNISGVAAGATNVTVYEIAGGTTNQIGISNLTSGFSAGTLAVNTTPLNQGVTIVATQIKTNTANGLPCLSQYPGTGPLVGGGANPPVRVLLECWSNSAYAGPIGANSAPPPTGAPFFLSASNFIAGFGTAPKGGRGLDADQCWQTVSFSVPEDPAIDSNSGGAVHIVNPFCSLEGLVFCINSQDNGPYDIYVDQIKNGDTVIEDFESYTDGTTNTFVAPNSPNPAASYLSGSATSSTISSAHAYDGSKACRIRWQWADTNIIRYAHIPASAATGHHYPQLDTSKPITARILVLPVGTSVAHIFNGSVGQISSSASPIYIFSTNTFSVTATGPGPFAYQWSINDFPITDATNATFECGGPGDHSLDDQVPYSVAVNDGFCTERRTMFVALSNPVPSIVTQPVKTIATAGTSPTFSVVGDGHVDPYGYPLTYQWQTNGVDMTGETTSSLTVTNAQLANAGFYDVVVANGYGSVTSSVVALDVVPLGISAGTGTGLRGNYWSNHVSGDAFTGVPVLSRVDSTVDFYFGTGSPSPLISSNTFTARWVGQVQALGDDTYTFLTTSDDGVRLWINGQLLVDNWTSHPPTTNSGSISLSGVQKYNLLMEYFENTGGSVAKLYWTNASGGIVYEAVPASQLYPGSATPTQPALGYAVANGTNINFSWGPGTYTIAWATNVTGPYSNKITGVISPYTLTNAIDSTAQKFFRLQVQ